MNRMATTQGLEEVKPIIELDAIQRARALVDQIHVDPRLMQYMVRLVRSTREPEGHGLPELAGQIQLGASPRATIVLSLAARANAFLEHRGYVTPGDVKRIAPHVLRHRVVPSYEAEAEGRDSDLLVARILETVPVP